MLHSKPYDKPASVVHREQPNDTQESEVKSKKVNTYFVYITPGIQSWLLQNFLAMNIESAARAQVKRPPSQQQLAALSAKRDKELSHYKRGIVPQ